MARSEDRNAITEVLLTLPDVPEGEEGDLVREEVTQRLWKSKTYRFLANLFQHVSDEEPSHLRDELASLIVKAAKNKPKFVTGLKAWWREGQCKDHVLSSNSNVMREESTRPFEPTWLSMDLEDFAMPRHLAASSNTRQGREAPGIPIRAASRLEETSKPLLPDWTSINVMDFSLPLHLARGQGQEAPGNPIGAGSGMESPSRGSLEIQTSHLSEEAGVPSKKPHMS